MTGRQATISPAYGSSADIGRYLNAPSGRTARRWLAELRAKGLPVYKFGQRERFRFSEVDSLLERGVDC